MNFMCSRAARPVSILSYGGTQDPNVNLDKLARMTEKRAQASGCDGKVVEQLSATATSQQEASPQLTLILEH